MVNLLIKQPVPMATRPHLYLRRWHLLSSLRIFPGFQALPPEAAEGKCVFLVLNQDGALPLPAGHQAPGNSSGQLSRVGRAFSSAGCTAQKTEELSEDRVTRPAPQSRARS